MLETPAIVDHPEDGWVQDVLRFWFERTRPNQWFEKDRTFDATIRDRFLGLHETLVFRDNNSLLADAQTALAAVIVLDQMSRNMFRGTPRAFASDEQALWLADAAIARGFDAGLSKDHRMFLYLPFEHAEDRRSQARCVELMASLGDPEVQKWAEAHRVIVDRFGRFPHRNAVLERVSTPDEIEFLKQPDSSF
jgi:uncharacterized protein (DUF924 family)